MKLELSIALSSNLRTEPVINGSVAAEGITLVPTVVHPSEMFWRQLRFAEFDVSEMSLSSLMMTIAKGDDRWVGLPVFTTRKFFHTGILVRRDAGIDTAADLKGKRVGIPEYQQTAALWIRGILQHEFGVAPADMEFWMERDLQHSHGGATGFSPPSGVTINQIAIEQSIGSMMVAGDLDAALFYIVDPNLIDRSTQNLWTHPDIKTLFSDPVAEGIRYYRKTGIYPINHGVVVKREIAERHPWVVLNLLTAFKRANAVVDARRLEHASYYIETGLLPPDARDALAKPIAPHGIVGNRRVLDTAAEFSYEQGLTPRKMKLEELFSERTMDH